MYTITLEVNQICNLQCAYCYLGDKTNQSMSDQVAYRGLEIAFLNAEKHKDRKLWVDFVGGEALMSFPVLQKLVEYTEKEAYKRNILVSYSITTNGTIMNNEILTWLIKYRVLLKLSIDGDQETHDRNRKTAFGAGSYINVIKNRDYFRKYEEKTKRLIQTAHVVTQNNYWEAFRSVQHLVENLNFRMIDTSIDVSCSWTIEQLDELGEEWENILCYYIKRREDKKDFFWIPVSDLKKYGERLENSGFCGVGLIQIYVKTNGGIYGCAANLGESGYLGNVDQGLLAHKIKKYRELAKVSTMCSDCAIHRKCQSKKCIMNNLSYCGLLDGHNPNICYFERKKIRLFEKYRMKIE